MNKTSVKKAFLKELDSGLPEVRGLRITKEKRKKKVLLLSCLIPAATISILVAILVPSINVYLQSNEKAKNKEIIIEPNHGGNSGDIRVESDDLKVSLIAKQGPFEKQIISVTFYHNGWFKRNIEGEEPLISYMNKEQETILKLTRYISYIPKQFFTEYDIKTVYEHHGTFYDHVCGEAFSKSSYFTIEDELTINDFPESYSYNEGFTYIDYVLSIEGTNGAPLEYEYRNKNMTSCDYIRSPSGSGIRYSINAKGIELFGNENSVYTKENKDMVIFPTKYYSVAMSSVPGQPIKFNLDNASFKCKIKKGSFEYYNEVKEITVNSNETIYYCPSFKRDGAFVDEYDSSYIDVIVNNKSGSIGYAIIGIIRQESNFEWRPQLLASILFTDINGKVVNVSSDFVEQTIANYHKAFSLL